MMIHHIVLRFYICTVLVENKSIDFQRFCQRYDNCNKDSLAHARLERSSGDQITSYEL